MARKQTTAVASRRPGRPGRRPQSSQNTLTVPTNANTNANITVAAQLTNAASPTAAVNTIPDASTNGNANAGANVNANANTDNNVNANVNENTPVTTPAAATPTVPGVAAPALANVNMNILNTAAISTLTANDWAALTAQLTVIQNQLAVQAAGGQDLVAPQTPPAPQPVALVPKPKGTYGGGKAGYNLQREMGLANNRVRYNQMKFDVRRATHSVGIRLGSRWSEIKPDDLLKVYQWMRKQHPYLRRFERNWATSDLLQQYLHYKRRKPRKPSDSDKENGGEANEDYDMEDLDDNMDLDFDGPDRDEGSSGAGAGAMVA